LAQRRAGYLSSVWSGRIAWLSACSALALAAGCGGAERQAIPADAAEALAARSDRVADALAQGDLCTADREADELVAAAEAADLPLAYRRPLLATARGLAARIECPPPPAAEDQGNQGNGKGEGEEKGKGKGRGRG